MELWIPITILAAFSQNLRSALQKHLKSRLSTGSNRRRPHEKLRGEMAGRRQY